MSKSNLHETAYLKLVFQNEAHANIGTVAGLQPSSADGVFEIALYTAIADGETDSMTEVTTGEYTNYARQTVVRSSTGWTVSGNAVTNALLITFPTSSGGTGATITHWAVRTDDGDDLIGSGTISSSITIDSGDTPKFEIGDITITED